MALNPFEQETQPLTDAPEDPFNPNTPLFGVTTQRGTLAPFETDEDPNSPLKLLDLDDVLFAIPRGVEGLIRSIADLPGVLPGVESAGFSQRKRFAGRSDSLVGGILEGLVQFVIPFGAASKALRLGGFLAKSASNARAAAAAGNAARAGLTAAAPGVARGLIAGAAGDAVAFSGNEERLSNLLVRADFLRNPITEFLAAG